MPGGNDKRFTGNKLRESGSRRYQPDETRIGDKRDRKGAEAGN